VDAEEIGRLIGDLENRVERLRSLYEQYFMGIERIEPLTARKDVDRRLWALRREQIRNTGLRFKLETTVQRYNTYQQYWMRIVREIEAGTYQRDLGRAAQRFGDNAVTGFARRRQKMFEKAVVKKAERDALKRTDPEASGQAPPADAGEEAPPPSSSDTYDVTFEESDAAEPAAMQRARAPIPEPIELLELDIGRTSRPPENPVATAPTVVAARTAEVRRAPAPAAPAVPARPTGPAAPPLPPRVPLVSSPGVLPGAFPPKPAAPLTPAAKPTAPVAPGTRQATPIATPAKPASRVATKVAPPTPAVAPARPALAARPAAPVAPKPAVAPVRPPIPSPPDPPGSAVRSEENSLSPIRMRQIYGAFVEAKRRANESTATVTYEKIASNLENVAKELRAKHKARSVDFEVVLKNGKPVLKPVVKS
jgi:hypothetical protein